MIKKFFHALLLRRRFWRYATMSEVAEIYMSRMLRVMALNMMSAFIVIYLYQNGFSVSLIAFIWAALYGFKMLIALPLATLVAWIGPKHSTFVSNLLYIPAMILFALIPIHGDWLIIPALTFQAVSTVLYTISHSVNFSKVKSLEHAGKEIAVMNIVEKVAAGLTPMLGGFLTLLWGPQVVIGISALLFLFAAAPLFRTGEQVQTRRVLKFRGFPWRLFFGQFGAHIATGFDGFASGVVWSLYVAIIVIGMGHGNEVYAVTGALLSVVFVVSLIFSYIYGRLIDRRKGWLLYKTGVLASVFVHAMRPFITTTIAVAGLNAVKEATNTAYMLPYTRASFDSADISGARSTYLGLTDATSNFGAALSSLALGVIALAIPQGAAGFHVFFFMTAAVMLLFLTARFPLYKK
ncbi:hypothetical protein KI440_00495 [Candidatus Saccharibacteria bacterium TM7i]|nr:hypothetical protein KI440_00495 [Candidatus Saccharibacteria bacterium TM7i]